MNVNKKLGLLMKIISCINITIIVTGSLFLLLYLKNTIGISFFYNVIMCTVCAILLYRDGADAYKMDGCVFCGKDKILSIMLLIIGIIISAIQNIMFLLEISGYEEGFSGAITAVGAFTLFDSVVKITKKYA